MMPSRFHTEMRRGVAGLFLFLAAGVCIPTTALAQPGQPTSLVTGANTNLGGGPAELTIQPTFRVRGDLLRKAQNEPSCGMSTRNPQHILCGANDYRMVDVPGVSITSEVRDAWLGEFQSIDGGDTWESTIHRGFFLDPAPHPFKTDNFKAAADPTVRTGPAGLAIYSGIAFSGPERDDGVVFASTYIDLNHREFDRMPFKFVRTVYIDRGNAGQFIDKPWTVVEANGGTCTLNVPLEDGTSVTQTIPGSTVHILYAVFVGNMDQVIRTKTMYAKSTDCGATFSRPVKVSESVAVNNGSSIAKPLVAGSKQLFGVWRRFATSNGQVSDAIVSIASADNGATWTKAAVVAEMCRYDQVTTKTQFRATGFPAMTADAGGRAYVFWADRGRDPVTRACRPLGASRIVMSTSTDGVTWSEPRPAVPSAGPEHQIWPAVAFVSGKLVLAWVDFKEDASQTFARVVDEKDAAVNVPPIRHTGDVRTAMADPGINPDFGADVAKVSRYLKGVGTLPDGRRVVGQVQWNAVNRRWAKRGKVPFNGDYIDIATAPYLPPDPDRGRPDWTPNDGTVPLTPTVLIAWTDNRDMRRVPGPENLHVEDPPGPPDVPYVTPLGLNELPSTSIFDPAQNRPVCLPGFNDYATGTMNQNVYAARATRAFAASTPGNNKPLGTIQRAFVVMVRNDTAALRQYRESVAAPPNGFASFDQFDTTKTSIIVNVPRYSSVARTVFVTPNPAAPAPLDPDAVVPVTVTELVNNAPGQQTTIYLNSDKSAPEIDGPEIDGPEIDGSEVYTPEIDGPEIDGHGSLAPEIDGPEIDGPEIDGGEILSVGVQTPEIDGPEIDGPEIDGPEIDGPEIDGSALDTSAVTDITYKITNKGNTTAQYNAKALVAGLAGGNYQIIVRRRYAIPAVDANCTASTVTISKVVVSILNSDVSSPEIDGSAIDTASFSAAPLETLDFVIRLRTLTVPSPAELAAIAASVEVLVQPEAVNTEDVKQGITEPPVYTSFLSIADSQLPSGVTGVPYSRQLQASGGEGALAWTLLEGGTGLPPGLSFGAGLISGTPTTPGTFTFTIDVRDSSAPAQVATKTFTIVITQGGTPSLAFVAQPSSTESGGVISPAPSVKAVDGSGAAAFGVPVTIVLGANPAGGTLLGTLTATTSLSGVATFPSLTINNAGSGYTLGATAPGHAPATSVAFDVGAPPDLVVQSLTHTPASPSTVTMVTFTAVVANNGGSAGPSTLRLTIGNEPAGSPGTLYAVPSLAPGATFTVQRQQTLSQGNYTVLASADYTNAVAESTEGNNDANDSVVVAAATGPQVFTVWNTNDAGPGSLRDAMTAANTNAGFTDTIVFAVLSRTLPVIAPSSPLPALTDPVIIDAPPTGDCSGAPPTVEINGASAGAGASGFVVIGGGTTIRGLSITGFAGNGILLQTGGGNRVDCNYIGLAPDGSSANGNGANGVHVIDSADNTIGGSAVARNVISANGGEGVRIDGALATNNLIEANYIGTSASGAADLGNTLSGVYIRRAPANRVFGNLVSGNDGFAGIAICGNPAGCGGGDVGQQGNNASGNEVKGNFVGTSASGASPLGNSQRGVSIDGAPDTAVGGTQPGDRNIISANGTVGVILFAGASGNRVQGNYIGTNASGTAALPNASDGVLVTDSPANIIGGAVLGAGNLISGNGGHGVSVLQAGSVGNEIFGNRIGTTADGTGAIPNAFHGVTIQMAQNTIVGGTTAAERNIIAGNGSTAGTGVGVAIQSGATGTLVRGNYIGTDAAGTGSLPNRMDGINIDTSSQNTIGGDIAGAGNVISGNGRLGIYISGVGANNRVEGNFIGTDNSGAQPLGNGGSGIEVATSSVTLIGGTTPEARNVISANVGGGIRIAGSNGNQVLGNYIGTDLTGTIDLGNAAYGITLNQAADNEVGGPAPGARNVVSGNNAGGIAITGPASTGNLVKGNFIGTDATGAAVLGNSGDGIFLQEASANTIGGTTPQERNVIAANGANGVNLLLGANNVVSGNFIGTDLSGTVRRGNSGDGVRVQSSTGNTIGGAAAGALNVISGNAAFGITLTGATTSGNTVAGNHIGTDVNGSTAIGNAGGIILENGAHDNVIGGAAGNVISGNSTFGVAVYASNNRLERNLIGTDAAGTGDLGNGQNGIAVGNVTAATILNNTVSGNSFSAPGFVGQPAIGIWTSSGVVLRGNRVGTRADGTGAIPNDADGIGYSDCTSLQIGGLAAGEGNIIAGNTRSGISGRDSTGTRILNNLIGVDAAAGAQGNGATGVNLVNEIDGEVAGNTIAHTANNGVMLAGGPTTVRLTQNSIYSNGSVGIDLVGGPVVDGVTPNDVGDGDAGPNGMQNFPVLTSASSVSGSTQISGTLNSAAGTTFTIDFYASPSCDTSGHGEGQRWLGSVDRTTDATGNVSFTATFGVGLTIGTVVAATATLSGTGTSEFSNCVEVAESTTAVWLLDNVDSPQDAVTALNAAGSALWTAGVAICQTVGAHRAIDASLSGDYVLVAEFCHPAGDRLTRFSSVGASVWSVAVPEVWAVDHSANGSAYALTGTTISGTSILRINPADGSTTQTALYGGIDLVVDDARDAVWIVGDEIKKLNRDLGFVFALDPIAWTAVSADLAPDGSLWVAERQFEPGRGLDRLLRISSTGDVVGTIALPSSPLSVRVTRSDGSIWVALADRLRKYGADGSVLFEASLAGWSVEVDQSDGSAWVAERNGTVRHFSSAGATLLVRAGAAGDPLRDAWLAVRQ